MREPARKLHAQLRWGHDQLIVEVRRYLPNLKSELLLLLQWGHDQLIVEGWPAKTSVSIASSLQWGHDQLIVEGMPPAMLCHPRSSRLQWGHDQLIVEGGGSRDSQGCLRPLNGATIG